MIETDFREYELRYTDHALERMEEAEVTRGDVKMVLETCSPKLCKDGLLFHAGTTEERLRLRAAICTEYGEFDVTIFDTIQPVFVVTNFGFDTIITAYREAGYQVGIDGNMYRTPGKLPSEEINKYV